MKVFCSCFISAQVLFLKMWKIFNISWIKQKMILMSQLLLSAFSSNTDILKVPASFVMTYEFSLRITKITSNVGEPCSYQLPFFISSFFDSKIYKADNFISHKSLKFSFTNTQGLHLKFTGCESLLESNFLDILVLCETNLDDWIDSTNFSLRD